jgi:DNA-directed RNA polymerase specialized sigma24 family protein
VQGGEERTFRRYQRDFDALFRAHYPEIVRYLAARLGSRDAAADVAGRRVRRACKRAPLPLARQAHARVATWVAPTWLPTT